MNKNGDWLYLPRFDRKEASVLLEKWKESYPTAGILALVAESNENQVEDLQQLCRQTGTPLVGGVFPAIISASQFVQQGILLIRMNIMPDYALVESLDSDHHIDSLSDRILAMADKHEEATLFIMFDAMVNNIGTILERIYLRLADGVKYSGVNAGSETFKPVPCLFDADSFIQGGALALLLAGKEDPLLTHGYPIPDQMVSATSSTGNCIQSIDWQPAFNVYQQFVQQWYQVEISSENFYELGVHFPFGILLANGEVLIRIPVALTEEGSLYCVGEIPENSILTLMQGPEQDLLGAVREFGETVANSPEKGLVFYCAGRRLHLGNEQAQEELDTLKDSMGNVIGALSLGEIGTAKDDSYPHFHNAALVHCPWCCHES